MPYYYYYYACMVAFLLAAVASESMSERPLHRPGTIRIDHSFESIHDTRVSPISVLSIRPYDTASLHLLATSRAL